MDCKKAETLLVEYLYRELSPRKTVDVEKHLQTCSRCLKTLESWQVIHQNFQKTVPEVSPFLKQRILNAAKHELLKEPSGLDKMVRILRPAFLIPVAVFALVALLYFPLRQGVPVAKAKAQPVTATSPEPARELAMDQKSKDLKPSTYDSEFGSRDGDAAKLSIERKAREYRDETKTQRLDQPSGAVLSEEPKSEQDDSLGKTQELSSPPPAQSPASPAEEPASEGGEKEAMQEKRFAAKPSATEAAPVLTSNVAAKELPPDVNFKEAQDSFKKNDLSRGRYYAQQAINEDKNKNKALAMQFHQAGIQYQNTKQTENAIVQFNLVLNNYPDYGNSADVLLRLGDSYREIGQYNEAMKTYQQLSKFTAMKKIAEERISDIGKKQKAQDELKSLGYVTPENP